MRALQPCCRSPKAKSAGAACAGERGPKAAAAADEGTKRGIGGMESHCKESSCSRAQQLTLPLLLPARGEQVAGYHLGQQLVWRAQAHEVHQPAGGRGKNL